MALIWHWWPLVLAAYACRYLMRIEQMWTKEEIAEIRNRAELEASIPGQNALWQHACLNLALSAGNLLEITERIEQHKLTAATEYYQGFNGTGIVDEKSAEKFAKRIAQAMR